MVLHKHAYRLFRKADVRFFSIFLFSAANCINEVIAFLTSGVKVRNVKHFNIHFFFRLCRFVVEESILDIVNKPPRLKWLCSVILERVFNRFALWVCLIFDKLENRLFFERLLHLSRLMLGSFKPTFYIVKNANNVFFNSGYYCFTNLVARVQKTVCLQLPENTWAGLWLYTDRIFHGIKNSAFLVVQVHFHVFVILFAQEPAMPELLIYVTQSIFVLLLR